MNLYINEHFYLFFIWLFLTAILVDAFVLPKRISISKRFRTKQALRNLKTLKSINDPAKKFAYLKKVNPYAFEEMINESLKSRKLLVKRTSSYSGDGGIDGIFFIRDEKFYMQAKRYSKYINPSHVVEFQKKCKHDKVRGIFVHSGKTGPKSKFIGNTHVTMISGIQLLNLLDGLPVIFTFSDKTFEI